MNLVVRRNCKNYQAEILATQEQRLLVKITPPLPGSKDPLILFLSKEYFADKYSDHLRELAGKK